jgi:hypothetical protein
LWIWMGPWALILWIPAILVPMSNKSRALVVLSTSLLTMPYVPVYSQLSLFLFPMPVFVWIFGALPWLQPIFGNDIFKVGFLVPFLFNVWIYKESVFTHKEKSLNQSPSIFPKERVH